jgi:hypothetical protein
MKIARRTLAFIFVPVLAFLISCGPRQRPSGGTLETAADVRAAFQSPPAEFRSAPLWVWNDRVTDAEIEDQLADFKDHGIGGVFIHPRPGLVTPYLSDEWMARWRHAVDVGKRLGLDVWIYDENSYPSGFGGGHVPAEMPDAVRSGLRMTTASVLPPTFDVSPLVVLRKTRAGFEDITARAKADAHSLGRGEYYIFDVNRQKPNPWYGGFTYVDLMHPGVTEKFLDVTMNAYKRVIGADFGGTVRGVFQDEAEINPAGGAGMTVVNYTPGLFDAFRAKWGYDLTTHLPSLYDEVGDWERVRHNFYATLLDLFIENWAVPYYQYCERNGLVFTGHYWEHEWPRPVVNPDNMAFAAYAHMPGVDILMNDFQTDTHAQFGNARGVKEIRSAANQLGRTRTMSETYGASGWDLTFFDQKRIADWEYALGVNFVNQHLSYVTIAGARKRDHPQSFSYHEPWWGHYRVLADYLGRLSVALSSGRQDNKIIVLEPTTTAWMAQSPRAETERMKAVGKEFQDFVNALESAQVEYDLGSEFILARFGAVRDGRLTVGQRAYDLVVLPPSLENLNGATLALLKDYLAQGGRILSWPSPPRFVDGRTDGGPANLAGQFPAQWLRATAESGPAQVATTIAPTLEFTLISPPGEERRLLFHHRRTLKDAELIFLANTDPRNAAVGSFTARAGSCERWDAFTGRIEPYPFTGRDGRLKIDFELPAGGSLLLCLKPSSGEPGTPAAAEGEEVRALGGITVERKAPNVLTLDYCDLTLGGTTEKNLYFYDAQLKTFRHHGLDRNPWDSAVQFKTSILDKDRFAPDSGFSADFPFRVADGVRTGSMQAVVERPALFQVLINGRPVAPLKGQWWLDRAFGVFDIGAAVQSGDNVLTVRSSPFTIFSELEPVYLLGDFNVEPAEPGFRVTPAAPLALGPWTGFGLPFYSNVVGYARTYRLDAGAERGVRYAVALRAWTGALAEVRVNGRPAGIIAFAPFRLDVTNLLKRGENKVEVLVYGTLKNTLGPHHNNPPLGRAWPGSFQQGAKGGRPAGAEYSFVGYGLFDDFLLMRTRRD